MQCISPALYDLDSPPQGNVVVCSKKDPIIPLAVEEKKKMKKKKSSGSLGSVVPLTVGKVIALCSAAAVTIMWETRKLNAHVAYGVTVGGLFA